MENTNEKLNTELDEMATHHQLTPDEEKELDSGMDELVAGMNSQPDNSPRVPDATQ